MTYTFNRRNALRFGAMGAAGLALAACGGPTVESGSSGTSSGGASPSGSSGGAAPSSAAGPDYTGVTPAKTIEWWSVHPGSSSELEAALVAAYNKSQSETVVKLVTAGKNYADVAQKFQTALASNQVPAVIMISDVWWFGYMLNGNLAPIEPLAKAVSLDTSDYVTAFYDDYLYNDSHWAVPYARSTPLFYYNKTHFAAAGLPDRAPATWDEVDEFAKKIKAKGLDTQAVLNWAKPDNYMAWYYQNEAWGWGGSYSDKWDLTPLTGDGMIKSLAWTAKTMKSNGGWSAVTSNAQADDLSAGTISMCLESTGAMKNLIKNAHDPIGAGSLPGGPATSKNVCPTGGTGIGIAAKVKPEEQIAGIKFLMWLTNPENCIKFSTGTGYLPVRKSADTSALLGTNPLMKFALGQMDNLHSQDWARVFITGGDLALGNGIGSILLEGKDPKTAMEGVAKALQTTYDRDIKPKL
ncbi:MAG: ABC transporter substrate-binding protein [Nakamurella sp.]